VIGEVTSLTRTETINFRCTPSITWVKDSGQIFLIDTDNGRSWTLCGTEATVWSFLTLGYRYEKIGRFLSLMLKIPEGEARKALMAMLREWQDRGIVQVTGENRRGEPGNQRGM